MGLPVIELPDFVTPELIERTYNRALHLQNHGREPWWNGGRRARMLRTVGVKMAMARDPKLMLFLEKGAEHLRRMNDAQKSRMSQHGYQTTDFGEFSLFKTAYEKCLDPKKDELFLHDTLGWIFAACAEALGY